MVRTGFSVATTLFLLAGVGSAAAQEGVGASATAESLFREAKDLMSQGNYAEACDKLEASYAIEETLGTLLNLANCHELEGRTATAWAEFLRAAGVARSAGQAERERIARERAEQLEPKLMRLQVEVPPEVRVEGLVVERDGVPIEEAAWGSAIPVDPGQHVVTARAPGKQTSEDTVQLLDDGETVLYELPLLAPLAEPEPTPPPAAVNVEPAPLPPSPTSDSLVADSDTGSGQRTLGIVVGAVGAAGLAAGSVFGVLAKNEWDDAEAAGCGTGTCPTSDGQQSSEDANRFATFGTIGMAGGGALLLGGIVLYLTAPSNSGAAASSSEPWVAAGVAPGRLSFEVKGVF